MKKTGIALGITTGIAGMVAGVTIGAMGTSGAVGTSAAADSVCAPQEYTTGLRYQQDSAEIRALQRQTYSLATSNLKAMVKRVPKAKRAKLAVMTDLDETVLDNTPLFVRDIEACHDFTSWDTWSDWEIHGDPGLIPGARAFLREAHKLGVTIYYVSGRYNKNKSYTMATLRKMGLPQVKSSRVKLSFTASKQVFRNQITKKHKIIMELGDSLADFSVKFSGASLAKQHTLVRKNASHFGHDWIVLPDSAYGSWDNAPLKAWNRPLSSSLGQ